MASVLATKSRCPNPRCQKELASELHAARHTWTHSPCRQAVGANFWVTFSPSKFCVCPYCRGVVLTDKYAQHSTQRVCRGWQSQYWVELAAPFLAPHGSTVETTCGSDQTLRGCRTCGEIHPTTGAHIWNKGDPSRFLSEPRVPRKDPAAVLASPFSLSTAPSASADSAAETRKRRGEFATDPAEPLPAPALRVSISTTVPHPVSAPADTADMQIDNTEAQSNMARARPAPSPTHMDAPVIDSSPVAEMDIDIASTAENVLALDGLPVPASAAAVCSSESDSTGSTCELDRMSSTDIVDSPPGTADAKPVAAIASHSAILQYQCSHCQARHQSAKARARHEKSCLKNPERSRFECPDCCQPFSRADSLKQHQKTAHVGDECPVTFIRTGTAALLAWTRSSKSGRARRSHVTLKLSKEARNQIDASLAVDATTLPLAESVSSGSIAPITAVDAASNATGDQAWRECIMATVRAAVSPCLLSVCDLTSPDHACVMQTTVLCDNSRCKADTVLPSGTEVSVVAAARCAHAQQALHWLTKLSYKQVVGIIDVELNNKISTWITSAKSVSDESRVAIHLMVAYANRLGVPLVVRPTGSLSDEILSVLLVDHSSNDVITQAWYGLCGRVNVTFEKRNSHYHCPCGAPFPCKHVHLALAFTEVNAPLRVSWLSQGTAATATSTAESKDDPSEFERHVAFHKREDSKRELERQRARKRTAYYLHHHVYPSIHDKRYIDAFRDRAFGGMTCRQPTRQHSQRPDGSCIECTWPNIVDDEDGKTACPFCNRPMASKPVIATLYSLQTSGTTSIVVHKCSICQHQILPKSVKEGVFVLNSAQAYSVPLLRDAAMSVLRGSPAKSTMQTMLGYVDAPKSSTVWNKHARAVIAYLMQSRHTYDFLDDIPGVPRFLKDQELPHLCLLCGFYPHIISIDGNRKACFTLRHSDLKAAQMAAGADVDIDTYWNNTFLATHAQAHSAIGLPPFEAGKVAPYVCPWSRHSPTYQLPKHNGEALESVLQPDRLQSDRALFTVKYGSVVPSEIAQTIKDERSTVPALRTILTDAGITIPAKVKQKCDLQQWLTEIVSGLGACMTKVYTRSSGKSGGSLDITCAHGLHLGSVITVGQETVKGVAQLITLFSAVPNLILYDNICSGEKDFVDALKSRGVNLDDRAGAVVPKSWLTHNSFETAARLELALKKKKDRSKLTVGELCKVLGSDYPIPAKVRSSAETLRQKQSLNQRIDAAIKKEKEAAEQAQRGVSSDKPAEQTAAGSQPAKPVPARVAFVARNLVSVPRIAIPGVPVVLSSHDAYVAPDMEADLAVDRPPHPVTHSKTCFLCHDRFHGQSHRDCLDRSLDLIQEVVAFVSGSPEHYNRKRNVNNPTLKHCTSHTFAVYLVLIPHHQNYEILASKVAKLRTTAKNAGQILVMDPATGILGFAADDSKTVADYENRAALATPPNAFTCASNFAAGRGLCECLECSAAKNPVLSTELPSDSVEPNLSSENAGTSS